MNRIPEDNRDAVTENEHWSVALGALRQPESPERDLWPTIEARLNPRGQQHRSRPFKTALVVRFSFAAAILLAIGAGLLETRPETGGSMVSASNDGAPADPVAAARTVLLANVAITDQAETTLQQAVAEDPHDARLRHLLQYARDEHQRMTVQLASL
jgi:hypothetical protein